MKQFKSLIHMLENSCQKFSENEMYGTKNSSGVYEWIKYKDFSQEVNNLRGGLYQIGLRSGNVVGIISKNCVEWAVCCYASLGLKASYVPMYESQKPSDWEHIIQDSKINFLIVSQLEIYHQIAYCLKKYPHLKKIIVIKEAQSFITYRDLLQEGKSHPCAVDYPSEDDFYGIVYTSGTTGKPKGVELTHKNILANIYRVPLHIDYNSSDRTLCFLPWAHIFGNVGEVHLMISKGASAGFAEAASTILTNLKEIKPTVLFSVPKIYVRIYDTIQKNIATKPLFFRQLFQRGIEVGLKRRKGEPISLYEKSIYSVAYFLIFSRIHKTIGGRLRYGISAGGALSKEVLMFFYSIDLNIYESYGLSETSPCVSGNSFDDFKIGSVGKVKSHEYSECRVVLKTDHLEAESLQSGEGEIIVYGDNVMYGYHNLPEESAKVIDSDGGFHTGDLGRIDKDGFLFISGRIKEQYKMENGKYVVPSAIEDTFKLSAYIEQVLLFGDNKPFNIAIICLDKDGVNNYLVKKKLISSSDSLITKNVAIKNFVQHELNMFKSQIRSYEFPNDFCIVDDEWGIDNGLLTPTLKPKRQVLVKKYAKEINKLYDKNIKNTSVSHQIKNLENPNQISL